MATTGLEVHGLRMESPGEESQPFRGFSVDGWPVNCSLVAQHNIQQGGVNLHVAVVLDEAQFAEFIHKSIYARSRGADHLCQGCLTYFRNDRFWTFLFAKICHEKKRSRETLLELNN